MLITFDVSDNNYIQFITYLLRLRYYKLYRDVNIISYKLVVKNRTLWKDYKIGMCMSYL